MSENGAEISSLEDDVFKTLGHQIRRDIIRVIGDNKGFRFSEILAATRIEESASLSYHLNSLGPLIDHKDGLY